MDRGGSVGWGVREEESGVGGLGLRFCYIVECSNGLWARPDILRRTHYTCLSL